MTSGQSLGLRQEPRWAMTPALWQAIGLLRMNAGELKRFAEAQAAENPFLRVRPGASRPARSGPAPDPAAGLARAETLHEAVSRQIGQIDWASDEETAVAYRFADALEPWGWLSTPASEIAAGAGVAPGVADRVLARLQELDPPGLFARGLTECLSLQLADRGQLGRSEKAVLEALHSGAEVSADALAETCGIPRREVLRVLDLLRRLDPKPGASFAAEAPLEVTPDVVVTRDGDGWRVDLNNSELPAVTVDDALMRRSEADRRGPDVARFRRAYGTARWLIEAIRRRNETVLGIAVELVRRQSGFVEQGPALLKPLSQRDLARHLSLSESSVSRVVGSCWAQLPRGVVPLAAFFATAVPRPGEAPAISVPMVRHLIAQRIGEEDPQRPQSDEALAGWLGSRGIALSRRTVAKYRAAMGIAGCRDRRRASRRANAC